MDGADHDDDDEFRPPLPMEDRLWRHPSELAAERRAAATVVTTVRTPWRHGVALASLGAIGGALVVAGLFLTLGSSTSEPATSEPVISTFAFDPVVPVARTVPADRWPAEVVAPVRAAVARIDAVAADTSVTGSGVVFRSDGLLMTSHDLVAEADEVTVTLLDGSTHAGSVLGSDTISGIAVVQIAETDIPSAPLAVIKPPAQIGDYTVALAGLAPTDSLELVRLSARAVSVPIDTSQHLHGMIQLDGGMPAGAEGGAVVDDAGSVIGIIVDMQTTNATYAVPVAYARKIADDILRFGHAKHPWLGIRGIDLDDEGAATLALDGAIRVTSVIDHSPAAVAGVRKGDAVAAIDDTPVLSMSELILELRKHPPGDDIAIEVVRDGARLELQTVLAVRDVGDST